MARSLAVNVVITAADQASPTLSRIIQSFAGLGTAATALAGALAGALIAAVIALVAAMNKAVDAASAQQESVVGLDAALRRLGPTAASTSRALQDQASALQATTRFSDDAIVKAQALLVTYGVQADQLQLATQATVDLAAAMGTDLDSAASKVGGTINGFTRGVEKIVPGLQNMSDEALKAGSGIAAIAEAMGGRAVAAANTYAGALEKVKNASDEVFEALGGATVESDALRAKQEELASALITVAGELKNSGGAWEKLLLLWTSLKVTATEVIAETLNMAHMFMTGQEALEKENIAAAAAAAALTQLAVATDATTAAKERSLRVETDFGNAISASAGIANELSVVLESSLNAQLQNNANKLATVEDAYRRGAITIRDYLVLTQALAAQQTELQGKLTGASLSWDAVAESTDSATESANQFQTSQIATRRSLQLSASQAIVTANAFRQLAAAQGYATTVQQAVDQGGKLILGGTRVLLPGGGSRLTTPPGFAKWDVPGSSFA